MNKLFQTASQPLIAPALQYYIMYTLVILNEREKPTIILFRKLIVLEWFNYANRIIRVSISSKIHHIIIISMYDVYDNILYSMYMSRYREKKPI